MMTPGYLKVLAPPFVACKKCGEMNEEKKGRLWYVTDGDGLTVQCDTCAYVEKRPNEGA